MGKTVKRDFNGKQFTVNGKEYRLECKLKQKIAPFSGQSHIKAIAVFTKWTGSRWKNTKSLKDIVLRLRGNVYNELTCSKLFVSLDKMFSKNRSTKIKLKTKDFELPGYFNTRKSLPLAINADFIWSYNNQTYFGNYQEVLKP